MEAVLARLPSQIIGIKRDAVPAQSWARIEGSESVGLGLGSIDDFPDVYAHSIAKHCHLVHEADVYISICIFENLLHLGYSRTRYARHSTLEDSFIDS